jgi:hypothetical protein
MKEFCKKKHRIMNVMYAVLEDFITLSFMEAREVIECRQVILATD